MKSNLYTGWDSNPHALRHQILNLKRLPNSATGAYLVLPYKPFEHILYSHCLELEPLAGIEPASHDYKSSVITFILKGLIPCFPWIRPGSNLLSVRT